jgi:hypothetical protein
LIGGGIVYKKYEEHIDRKVSEIVHSCKKYMSRKAMPKDNSSIANLYGFGTI